jgi:endonuclease III
MCQEKIVDILVKRGNELFDLPYEKIRFTGNDGADNLLNNFNEFSHAYVFACVMDRQIKAERAWLIPYLVSLEIGDFDFNTLLKLNINTIKNIFKNKKLHRFNDIMSENFYSAIQLIHTKYKNKASNIWNDNPKSSTVIRRFLEFKGVGMKISTMAANILVRDYKIPMQDRCYIDISPDVQVKRVFSRLGLISKEASNEDLIYCGRELHKEYPGIFDFSAWEIGRVWCRPKNPNCKNCYLSQYCPKNI